MSVDPPVVTVTDANIIRIAAEHVPDVLKKYKIFWIVGEGFSSHVVLAKQIADNRRKYAIKIFGIKRFSSDVQSEIEILTLVSGLTNVAEYIEHFLYENSAAIVFNYFNSEPFKSSFRFFTPHQAKVYILNLLQALNGVHDLQLVHNDIKPSNFLMNMDTEEFNLIDFGFAQRVGTPLRNRGTKGYQPPEAILKHTASVAADMWSAGIVLAILLSGVLPFFYSKGNDALKEFCIVFGTNEMMNLGNVLERKDRVTSTVKELTFRKPFSLTKLCRLFRYFEDLKQRKLGNSKCSNCFQYKRLCVCEHTIGDPSNLLEKVNDPFPKSAYDLLNDMLQLNPSRRITSKAALQHKFFTELLNTQHKYLPQGVPSRACFRYGVVEGLTRTCGANEDSSFTSAENNS